MILVWLAASELVANLILGEKNIIQSEFWSILWLDANMQHGCVLTNVTCKDFSPDYQEQFTLQRIKWF